ncbi:MAG: hypothetical protein RBR22_00025 [Desulfuromonas sp.]|nr:hypothetical protein [Desulfuromonas sp.]
MCSELNKNLGKIKDLLQQERHCFITLDMKNLPQLLQRKTQILSDLSLFPADAGNAEQQQLLRDISYENQRNARLIRHAEERISQCLSFYIKSEPSGYYCCNGAIGPAVIPCQLLSGSV